MPEHSDCIGNRDGQPVLNGSDVSIAQLVHRAHEDGAAAVLAATPDSGGELCAQRFEHILTYCAEQRCTAAGLACRGCRLKTVNDGLQSVDDWLAQFARVTITATGTTVYAGGSGATEVESLDWLQRHWAGQEYWFWARRVLRKLRYGVRQVDDLVSTAGRDLRPPAIILAEPQIPENIGMVARAMGNFALDDLRVINPRDGWPSEKARAVASGAAAIIDDAARHPSLVSAIGDLNWVAATTARQRTLRKPVMTPDAAAREMTARISRGESCGILFGCERNGLSSDEVAHADAIVMIPINNRFASLNLAQSVLLLGYEWLRASGSGSLGRVTTFEHPVESGLNLGAQRPATKRELTDLFEHLERELERRGFFYPSHRRHVVVRNIRTMLARMQATDQEIRTMRGIIATLTRGKEKPPETAE